MITPLQIDQLTRDTYSEYDAIAIAQLASLAFDPCYKPKLYKAPDSTNEVILSGQRVTYGLSITPGDDAYLAGFGLTPVAESFIIGWKGSKVYQRS